MGNVLRERYTKSSVLKVLEREHSNLMKMRSVCSKIKHGLRFQKDKDVLATFDNYVDKAQNKINELLGRIKRFD